MHGQVVEKGFVYAEIIPRDLSMVFQKKMILSTCTLVLQFANDRLGGGHMGNE